MNVAASWAKRSGISAAALREVGVPASVLRRAGLLCEREEAMNCAADRQWGCVMTQQVLLGERQGESA